MNIPQVLPWGAGSVLAGALFLSALPGAAVFAPPVDRSRQAAVPWTIQRTTYSGVAGRTLDLRVNDSGVADLWSRNPAGRVCYSLSGARLRELNGLIAQLDPAARSNRPAGLPRIPDMPSSGLTVTRAGRSIDVGRTRQPAAVSKRLQEIVAQLAEEGRQRVRAGLNGQPVLPGVVPCPAKGPQR